MPSWARQLVLRLTFLVIACVAILGAAWALSGNPGQQGVAQDSAPKLEPAKQPDAAPTDSAKAASEPKKTAVTAEPSRPPRNTKSQNLIEVDLSKLPPDLAKEVRAAIVEKGQPSAKQGSDKKRPQPEAKPATPPKEGANP